VSLTGGISFILVFKSLLNINLDRFHAENTLSLEKFGFAGAPDPEIGEKRKPG
jgi:hypothetical protein